MHAHCCDISDTQYAVLGELGDSSAWYCPTCVLWQLPFANCSFVSDSASSGSDIDSDTDCPFSNNSTVLLCHINIHSLLPSFDEVREFLSSLTRPVILGINETWLHSSVMLGEIAIPGYVVYRRDRNSRGGGVLVYVAHSCRSWCRHDLEDSTVEAVWVELRAGSHPMLLCVMYRPHSSAGSLLATVGHMLELAGGERKEVILMGDLNINTLGASSLLSTWNLIAEEFSLTQLHLISGPTCVSIATESLLDVIFVTDPQLFAASGTMAFSNSDHLLIYAEQYDQVKGSSKFTQVCYF